MPQPRKNNEEDVKLHKPSKYKATYVGTTNFFQHRGSSATLSCLSIGERQSSLAAAAVCHPAPLVPSPVRIEEDAQPISLIICKPNNRRAVENKRRFGTLEGGTTATQYPQLGVFRPCQRYDGVRYGTAKKAKKKHLPPVGAGHLSNLRRTVCVACRIRLPSRCLCRACGHVPIPAAMSSSCRMECTHILQLVDSLRSLAVQ